LIGKHFQSRTPRQCRDRWRHYLNPEITVGNWTQAEEKMLIDKVAELGQRWAAIAQLFPGRTDIGVKNHYISLISQRAKEKVVQSSSRIQPPSKTLTVEGPPIGFDHLQGSKAGAGQGLETPGQLGDYPQ
jgi:hypothetical protein